MNTELFHNTDLERNVLGGVIHDNSLLDEFFEMPGDLFYDSKHHELFSIFKDFKTNKVYIDEQTLASRILKDKPKGLTVTYIAELTDSITTLSNFKTHLRLLQDYYMKRQLKDLVYKDIDFTKEADEIKEKILGSLNNIYSEDKTEEDISDYLMGYLQRLYEPNKDLGLKTGYKSLDSHLSGFNRGELITISAGAGIGKTTLAINIFLNMLRQNYKIDFFTLEVPKEEILNKVFSNMCALPFDSIRNNVLTDKDKERMISAINFVSAKKPNIYEANSDIDYICGQIRKDKINKKVDIAFVDLINRVTSRIKTSNRAEFISNMTRKLKLLALELKIPIVITAQINREVEKEGKRPELPDLKESGGIAEDSDTVIALYRNRKLEDKETVVALQKLGKLDYKSKNPDVNPERIEVIILKARYSSRAKNSMKWLPEYQKIVEV